MAASISKCSLAVSPRLNSATRDGATVVLAPQRSTAQTNTRGLRSISFTQIPDITVEIDTASKPTLFLFDPKYKLRSEERRTRRRETEEDRHRHDARLPRRHPHGAANGSCNTREFSIQVRRRPTATGSPRSRLAPTTRRRVGVAVAARTLGSTRRGLIASFATRWAPAVTKPWPERSLVVARYAAYSGIRAGRA